MPSERNGRFSGAETVLVAMSSGSIKEEGGECHEED
jgi:hypothetical protein